MESGRMELGRKIAFYRKNLNITQDALARQLGISNQAVSKWETDQCYPDLELLPRIADIFGITLDELFDREPTTGAATASGSSPDAAPSKQCTDPLSTENLPGAESLQGAANPQNTGNLPWEDDGKLRAVLFLGQSLVQEQELEKRFGKICKEFTFCYEGPARDIVSHFNVSCEEVGGSVTAGGNVSCCGVGGDIAAGAYVECEEVSGDIAAGAYVECGCVGGSISAGAYVECEDVNGTGSITCGSYIECGDITGNITCGSYIECGDISGDVSAEGNIECGDISGDATAGGKILCGDVGGNVYRR